MTTPTDGSFEYNDDSVVARLSVDIPNTAVTDIAQLTSAMGAMRTELEAISRAQGDWLSYLQQMPVIVEQSNQALRNQITLMERMSYLQAEIGPGAAGGGAFSGGGAGDRPSGGEGAGGYSTAAPAGYQNPFEGMQSGTGDHGGGAAGMVGAAGAAMQAMQGMDARTAANMAAARGLPINPALLGALGGAAASALGMMGGNGNNIGTTDSQSPQAGNANRTAGKASNPNQRGQSIDAENQDDPAPAGDDASPMRQMFDGVLSGVKNEIGKLGGQGILGKGASILKAGGKAFGAAGGNMGITGKVLKGAGLLSMGAVAAHQIQNIGEDITEYQQLGSVRGGDYATGMKMELENRIRALDPFVNLGQTREAMQAAYGAGFGEKDISEVQSFAITNFKELGMSMQETARMLASAMQGTNFSDKGPGSTLEKRTELEGILNTMKEMSNDGGATFPERRQQLAAALEDLVGGGMSADLVERGTLKLQEGFADSRSLSKSGTSIAQNILNSPTLSAIGATRMGLNGVYPGAMKAALAENGMDQADMLQVVAQEMAQAVQGVQPRYNQVAMFMDLMNQQGAGIPDYESAADLLDSVTGGGPGPADKGAQAIRAQGTEKNKQSNWNPLTGIRDTLWPVMDALNPFSDRKLADVPQDTVDAFLGYHDPSENAKRAADMVPDRPVSANFPVNSGQVPQISASGQVTGTLRITIDQQGNASAPASIELTGTQIAAMLGQGSAQVNNPGPGESHATPPFRGGR